MRHCMYNMHYKDRYHCFLRYLRSMRKRLDYPYSHGRLPERKFSFVYLSYVIVCTHRSRGTVHVDSLTTVTHVSFFIQGVSELAHSL